jgi:hypothetical protein
LTTSALHPDDRRLRKGWESLKRVLAPAEETILKATPLILLACAARARPVLAGNCCSPTKTEGGRPGNRAAGAADAAGADDADDPAPAKALRHLQIMTIFPPSRWGRVRVGVMLPRRAGSKSYASSGISFGVIARCVQRQGFTPSQYLLHPGGGIHIFTKAIRDEAQFV